MGFVKEGVWPPHQVLGNGLVMFMCLVFLLVSLAFNKSFAWVSLAFLVFIPLVAFSVPFLFSAFFASFCICFSGLLRLSAFLTSFWICFSDMPSFFHGA